MKQWISQRRIKDQAYLSQKQEEGETVREYIQAKSELYQQTKGVEDWVIEEFEPRVFCRNASDGLADPDLGWRWEDSAGWWNPQKTEDDSLQEWCKDVAPDLEAFIKVLEHCAQKFHILQQLEGSAAQARLKHVGA